MLVGNFERNGFLRVELGDSDRQFRTKLVLNQITALLAGRDQWGDF